MKRLMFLFAVVLAAVSAKAYDFEVDGIYYNVISLDDLTCEVTHKGEMDELGTLMASYSGYVVIPATVTVNNRTLTVTRIGAKAFYLCSGMTSLVIPNSVTTIGKEAFYDCSSLASVVIPNSVTEIGWCAFAYCI